MPDRPLRLFVALYPPPEASSAILGALPDEARTHRVVPAHQVHLTLFFIGDTHPRELRDVRESVERAASGLPAFHLTPTRLITLPERGPARLIACETDQPAPLMELQRRLVQRLVRRPGRSMDNRFRPHITLCRFREGGPAPARVDEPLSLPPFAISEIALMQSVLRATGPEHAAVHRVGLG